jgi:hypothetical protein
MHTEPVKNTVSAIIRLDDFRCNVFVFHIFVSVLGAAVVHIIIARSGDLPRGVRKSRSPIPACGFPASVVCGSWRRRDSIPSRSVVILTSVPTGPRICDAQSSGVIPSVDRPITCVMISPFCTPACSALPPGCTATTCKREPAFIFERSDASIRPLHGCGAKSACHRSA